MRPCFLVVDQEYPGSISTRKLVIETEKFNVLTAYSAQEAIDTLRRFPALDGIVMDADMPDMPCSKLVSALRSIAPRLPVITVGMQGQERCEDVEYQLESFDPKQLLAVLQKLNPKAMSVMEKREQELKREK